MKSQTLALKVASALFMLVALGHGIRMVLGWKVMVGDYALAAWMSIPVVVVCVGLSAWMWMAAGCNKAPETPAQPKP